MLKWAVIFFVISIIAAIFGFGGISEGAGRHCQNVIFYFSCIVCPHSHFRGKDFW